MNTPASTNPSKNHRFPVAIISHGVWLYFRFCLSYRDVEELLFARGIVVTYEAIRKWCRKFGQPSANALRRRRPKPGDTWHMDEVFLTIHGKRYDLWRAVDQQGNVLDILVQRRRDQQDRYLNNRAENSHQPTRQRERRMQGFKSPGHAQQSLSACGPIAQHFRPRRHRLSASDYRQEMRRRFDTWQELTTFPPPHNRQNRRPSCSFLPGDPVGRQ